jgi:biopolymer transport protein ExbD
MNFPKRKAVKTDINLTPLIDIVFLLLIFFMLISNFVEEESLNIELPQASSSVSIDENKEIIVSIDKAGLFYINGMKTTKSFLQSQLKGQLETSKTKEVFVSGDKKSSLQDIIFIMDVAKKSGAKSVSIKTQSI